MSTWKLSAEVVKALDAAHAALSEEVSELRGEYDEKADAWRDGGKGTDVDAWIEGLERLADDLSGYERKP